MAKQVIKAGFTDYTALVFIPDPASTDGSGKTGLVAANLTVSGTRVETDNDVTVTDYTSSLNDLAALTTAHTDWGLLEVSSTLAPGLYRLDIADAIFAAGAWSAVVYVMITTSAAAASPMEFTLVAYDINDGVRMGLTALPNAAADAAGGLVISDAGGLDIDGRLDAAVSSRMATYAQPTGFLAATFPNGTVANTTNISAGTITTVTGAVGSVTGLTASDVGAIKAKTDNLPASPAAVGSAMTLTSGERNAVADAQLARNVSGGSSTGRTVSQALHVLRNKTEIAGGTLTVYDTDDSTPSFTATVTTAAGDPISSIDPA